MLKNAVGQSTRLLQASIGPQYRPAAVRTFTSSPIFSSPNPPPPSSPRPPSAFPSRPDPAPPKPHLTPREAEDKATEEKGTRPAPFLSRALGVVEPPSKAKKSREEWRADLLNREKRLEERRHLCVGRSGDLREEKNGD